MPDGFNPADAPAARPPFNEEAEQAVLGIVLVNNRAYERVAETLRPEHFFDPAHARVYLACEEVIQAGGVANPVTIRRRLDGDAAFADLGGAAVYLARLAAAIVAVHAVEDYAATIIDCAKRRQLIEIGEQLSREAAANGFSADGADALIERYEGRIFELAAEGAGASKAVSLDTAMDRALEMTERAYKTPGGVTGLSTGLRGLDAKLGGLHPSDLVIIAGRPGMGKTAIATNIAYNAALAHLRSDGAQGAPVGFFSMEMSEDQLAARILSAAAGVSSDRMRRGEITSWQMERLVETRQWLRGGPLRIDPTPALTIDALRLRARGMKRQHKVGLLVVDYLQLMSGARSRNQDNRVQEVSEITRGLKGIAKDLDIPVIALSQLSRQVENRDDKRPQLADLRDSGSIEQDADVVMFAYREHYYLERAEPQKRADESAEKFGDRYQQWQERLTACAHTADLIIAKQRHGPTGTVRLAFDGELTKFSDLDQRHDA